MGIYAIKKDGKLYALRVGGVTKALTGPIPTDQPPIPPEPEIEYQWGEPQYINMYVCDTESEDAAYYYYKLTNNGTQINLACGKTILLALNAGENHINAMFDDGSDIAIASFDDEGYLMSLWDSVNGNPMYTQVASFFYVCAASVYDVRDSVVFDETNQQEFDGLISPADVAAAVFWDANAGSWAYAENASFVA